MRACMDIAGWLAGLGWDDGYEWAGFRGERCLWLCMYVCMYVCMGEGGYRGISRSVLGKS